MAIPLWTSSAWAASHSWSVEERSFIAPLRIGRGRGVWAWERRAMLILPSGQAMRDRCRIRGADPRYWALYALLDRDDAGYRTCRRLIENVDEPLVIPAPVLVEVDLLDSPASASRHTGGFIGRCVLRCVPGAGPRPG